MRPLGRRVGRGYRDALAANEISKSPDVSWRAVVNGWNLARRLQPEWPQVVLVLPNLQKRIKFDAAMYQESFRSDLERLCQTLRTPDPLAEDGRLKPLRPATIMPYRAQLLRFAAHLVNTGVPIDAIKDVRT